ncbi:peptidyl-prolyl cis-trans isomerase [Oceaniglobus roseus]|uniref:peptidyl-prolyl cis-trans isomerase n=1 Tax=Oceaniglobus roseus TaxID=1737570 RepID=UPI000C7EDC62|nr:peptidyl-prolyl cis-trans isomerase [Kandeliimicrobium roseum]
MAKGAARKASDFFVWLILLLLVVGLAGFGAVNFGGSVRSIGRVGDTEISTDRYAQAVQQELRSLQAQTGQQFTFAQAQAFGLDRAVLQQVVASAALENEADRIGLSVGDAAVQRELLRVPAFQGLNGGFDRDAYTAALRQVGQSVGQFEESIRDDTARTLLQGALVAATATPPVFTDTLYTYAREQRDITYVPFGPGDLAEPLPEPDEATLKAYYDAHPETFTLPERRKITYAWLSPQMMTDKVEVDDADLRALYDQRIDEFVQPERRLVERLVFGSEQEAADAKAAIDAGETTFDDLVEQRGLSLQDVDLGDLSKAQLGQAGDAVFAVEGTGVAGPVETDLGPALFRVNGVLAAQERSFEEVRPELVDEFAADAARRLVSDQIDPVDDLLAGGATLEDVAQETPLELGTLLLSDQSSEPIAAYTEFRTAAEAAEVGDFPEVGQLADGGIFALRLDEIVPPALQPFEDVKVAVISAWEQDETNKALVAQAEALKQSVDGGQAIDTAPVAPVEQKGLLRDGFVEGAPNEMVTAAFEMQPGETRVLSDANGAVLLRLDAVVAPDMETEEAQKIRTDFSAQTAQSYARDMADAFTRAIETNAGIQLNQAAINAVNAQFP